MLLVPLSFWLLFIPPSLLKTNSIRQSSLCSVPMEFHICGDAYVDFFAYLGDGGWPEHGGDSRLDQPVKTYAGGSSTNTATHLRALQKNFSEHSPPVYLHTVLNPDDHYGQLLLGHADEHGFPIINCRKERNNLSTGHCIAIVSGGERSFMTHQGCVGEFTADDISVDKIVSGKGVVHFHIAGYYNIPGFFGQLEKVVQKIRKAASATVSLVTQHDATRVWDGGFDSLLPLLDFAIMNDLEAKNIVCRGQGGKQEPESEDERIENWATWFASIAPETIVVVTRGELGAVALKNGRVIVDQPTIAVKPVDPTGAGDAFTAGFIHGIWAWRSQRSRSAKDNDTNPWPVEAIVEGLRWGCATGRAAVLIRGASVPPPIDNIVNFRETLETM